MTPANCVSVSTMVSTTVRSAHRRRLSVLGGAFRSVGQPRRRRSGRRPTSRTGMPPALADVAHGAATRLLKEYRRHLHTFETGQEVAPGVVVARTGARLMGRLTARRLTSGKESLPARSGGAKIHALGLVGFAASTRANERAQCASGFISKRGNQRKPLISKRKMVGDHGLEPWTR